MKQKTLNKLIAMLVLFALMFTNFGYPVAAIATSDGFQVITNGFFKKDEIEFSAFFEDNEKKTDESISDVNKEVELKLKISPMVEGYLKNANIKAVAASEDQINFKITNAEIISGETEKSENEDTDGEKNKEENIVNSNAVENDVVENETAETNTVSEETNTTSSVPIQNVSQNSTANTVNTNTANESVPENTVENAVENPTNAVTNTSTSIPIKTTNTVYIEETNENGNVEDAVSAAITVPINTQTPQTENTDEVNLETEVENSQMENVPQVPAEDPEDDILINEEKVIEEKTEQVKEEEKIDVTSDIQIIAENEINIINVLKETTIILTIEYVQNENLNVADLYKEIKLQLSGTYINVDLEEIAVAKEDSVYIGWKYNKDIEVNSEYTKVSPFKIGEKEGTIVENKITVKRDTEDEKYLPLKSTKLEVIIPTFNEKMPTDVDVYTTKLMATRGEDTGNTTFSKENWTYDKENGKILITVTNEENGQAKNTLGEDEYVIIYRFEDYAEGMNSNLERNVKVEAEQYSALQNVVSTKEIKEGQEVNINVGELITYSINTNEEKIQKAKIYANYNSAEPIYETEYTSHVVVNILTSDMLETLKIDSSKEVYKDINGFEFQAEGIKYKEIKFNYSEIKSIVSKGGNVEIHNKNGELLYTLNDTLVTKEEDCIINLNYADGIEIYVNNISSNGNINFEVTKVIKNCNFDKAAFKNFKQIESRITAEVKYANLEEKITLQEIGATKDFEESYTKANLYLNKENLTTIQDNENVEIKIELNNDKENSDLYVNPNFELVFPKYVTEVNVESINLLYENGLRVKDFETYTESDIVKMRVELEGTQTTFSESTATNGTNILINVRIKVDDYTPSKEDQIKLYYCNEGVSNYESQTKWTISKQVPNGILKTTNGFDVALFKYQAPNGLVAINGITNYDGNLSAIKSVKQGTTMRQIPLESPSRISTMELLILNNTGNECSDVVMLGRIPFKGNKDVISNEDLKTTTDALMKDFIKEDILNQNMVEIYYSENENTNKSLSDGANGWRTAENISDISKIRSFLMVVKGNLKPGAVLRFSYDFEIPENLPYEVSMVGSFGAYYNNNTDVAVVYESSRADLVGLTTEAGPKVEAKLNVDIGNGATVGETRFLNYTLTVVNSGSVTAEGITVTNPLPENGSFYEYTSGNGMGNNNYTLNTSHELKWNIDKLEPGETKTFNYMVKTHEIPDMVEYWSNKLGYEVKQDENGYYYDKVVDVEYIEKEVEVEADVESAPIAMEGESNVEGLEESVGETEITNEEPVPESTEESTNENIEEPIVDESEEEIEEPIEDSEEIIEDTIENPEEAPEEHPEEEQPEEPIEEETEHKVVTEHVYKTEKVYLDPVPNVYITNKALVEVSNLAITAESNETKNLLQHSNFDIEVNTEWSPVLSIGSRFLYMSTITNITGKTQKNVIVECKLPETTDYISPEVYRFSHEELYDNKNVYYDENTRTVSFLFDEIYEDEVINAYVQAEVISGNNSYVDNYFTVMTEDGTEEKSSIMSRLYAGPQLEIKQTSNLENNTVKEGEEVELVISIANIGNYRAENVRVVDKISENLSYVTAKASGSVNEDIILNTETLDYEISEIPVNGKVLITIKGTAAKLNGVSKTISNFATISTEFIDSQQTNVININIKENPELLEKEEEERREQENNSADYITGPDTQNGQDTSNPSQDSNNGNDFSDNNGENGIPSDGTTNNGDANNNTDNGQDSNSNDGTNGDSLNQQVEGANHSISGYVWLDINRDGRKDENEENVSAVIVQLSKDGNMIKATTTDGNGKYEFAELKNGNYAVTFKYDEEKYVGTSYKKPNVEEDLNSDAVQTNDGMAVTNKFQIADLSIENMNLGLQNKNIFDLSISKFITKAKVTSKGKEESYKFDNLSLAKFEIPAKKIENSVVEIEYSIIIENTGNVSGNAVSIVDYLPEDMSFDESKNKGWFLGTDGNIYNETLKDNEIEPGETRELRIVLTKQMTGENTGVISNKVEIAKAENKDGIEEDITNNKATQETIVSIKTGAAIVYTGVAIAGVAVIAAVYMIATKKIEIKNFYNNKKQKIKFTNKKMYK